MTKDDTSGPKPLRYQETGNVHLDFHGATNTTIDFIIDRYGIDVLNEIFSKVARNVYVDIHTNLKNGNAEELVRHWQYFFERENGDFTIEADEDEITLIVRKCPAYLHVKKIAPSVSTHFCDQTVKTNEALAEGTPFSIETTITGEASCRQVIRRRS